MPIKVLSPQVASKIAAGEVVERPASVVKELIENSLDAGAASITVETRGGGVNFIKIIDNGCGIPSGEAEIAFSRHATSKIDRLEDLEKLSTLGFRGEALPSIAAVADVELLTQTSGENAGDYLRLSNGQVILREKQGRAPGTTVTVHNLFRHFPARLKFLKSAATENGHIANLVTQYALAFSEVKITYIVEGREVINTPGNGRLLDAVTEVYGAEVAGKMLQAEYSEGGCAVAGLVSPPDLSRANRNYLSFFVNRRWVHSAILNHASEDAYMGLLMTGKHPVIILNISAPPQDIDVNVHPSKIEVKFRNNQVIYAVVEKAVKKALEASPLPEVKNTLTFSPVPAPIGLWEHPRVTPEESARALEIQQPARPNLAALPVLRVLGQLAASYILAEGPDGLYLIAQHAAHERIQYEKVTAQKAENKPEIQGLLEPLQVELSPKQSEAVDSQQDLLGAYGITLEPFGGRSYLLRAVPVVMAGSNLPDAVKEMIDSMASEKDSGKQQEKLLQTIACHSAVRAGQQLSMEEMKELVRQLEGAENPRTCPHGRPTMIHLSSYQLAKEFGRVR